MQRLFAGLLFALVCHGQVSADEFYTPDFAPGAFKLQRGPSNEVLVLGTVHLSQMPKSFDPAHLDLLIARLASWQPQAIAIEAISGIECAFLRSDPQRFGDAIKSYCWDPALATAATGLNVVEANTQARRMLATWPALPALPSPMQRRALAALFLAAGEPTSALVQWLRLPAPERHADAALTPALVALLEKQRERRNENALISAPLAAQLGLERVYGVDDQSEDGPDDADEKAYGEAISKAWDNPYTAARKRVDEAYEGHLNTAAQVLAMYRTYNGHGAAEQTFHSDFGAALEEPSPQRFGRRYVGYWETRNLRMASNIREIMMARPGIRTLVIVGASHKAYLEAYLNQMHDMRIVSSDKLLR